MPRGLGTTAIFRVRAYRLGSRCSLPRRPLPRLDPFKAALDPFKAALDSVKAALDSVKAALDPVKARDDDLLAFLNTSQTDIDPVDTLPKLADIPMNALPKGVDFLPDIFAECTGLRVDIFAECADFRADIFPECADFRVDIFPECADFRVDMVLQRADIPTQFPYLGAQRLDGTHDCPSGAADQHPGGHEHGADDRRDLCPAGHGAALRCRRS